MFARRALNLAKESLTLKASLSTVKPRDIGVIGVPFCKGQPREGVAQAPQHLRQAGLLKQLEVLGFRVEDHGDLQFDEFSDDKPAYNIKFPRTIGMATKKISEKVNYIIKKKQTCLSLGGDHTMSIGTVHGHLMAEPNSVLVWVDAHADINPPLASPTGNFHGMPLSFLVHELREYIPAVPGFEWQKSCISGKDIAFIGLRDLDPAERYIIDHIGITCFTMHEIDRFGIDFVIQKTLEKINPGLKRPMHLSYDIDALDPLVSPSTGTPVPGGLTIREGMFVAEEMANTGQLTGIDLVEVNPVLGNQFDQDRTLFTACEVIAALFGKRRKGGQVPEGFKLPKP